MHAVTQLPPDRMTPEQRRREVASILADGLVRLRYCSFQASEKAATESEFELGFLANQSVHTDPVNNHEEESQ